MRDEAFDVLLQPKSIRNSQVVRELDPRASRDLVWSFLLVAALVAGLALYAWPHLALHQTGMATEQMYHERERLREENRKLGLEKASLEQLRRVESIATRELGLAAPSADRIVVVERPKPLPDVARLARGQNPREEARN